MEINGKSSSAVPRTNRMARHPIFDLKEGEHREQAAPGPFPDRKRARARHTNLGALLASLSRSLKRYEVPGHGAQPG
jgi:hypothetical protein